MSFISLLLLDNAIQRGEVICPRSPSEVGKGMGTQSSLLLSALGTRAYDLFHNTPRLPLTFLRASLHPHSNPPHPSLS